MTTEKDIENKLEELAQAIGSDESMAEKVIAHINAEPVAEFNRIERRFIMNRFTKFAAAAMIIIAAALSITFLNKLVTPAYAIEQTIEAVKNVRFMHIVQRDRAGNIEDEVDRDWSRRISS